jgi:hypothetical protein
MHPRQCIYRNFWALYAATSACKDGRIPPFRPHYKSVQNRTKWVTNSYKLLQVHTSSYKLLQVRTRSYKRGRPSSASRQTTTVLRRPSDGLGTVKDVARMRYFFFCFCGSGAQLSGGSTVSKQDRACRCSAVRCGAGWRLPQWGVDGGVAATPVGLWTQNHRV